MAFPLIARRNLSVRSKLILCLSLSVLPLLLFAAILAFTFSESMTAQGYEHLASVQDVKRNQVAELFKERLATAQVFVGEVSSYAMSENNTPALHYLKEFSIGAMHLTKLDNERAESLQSLFSGHTGALASSRSENNLIRRAYYDNIHADFHTRLRSFSERFGIDDMYLIERRGRVVYSVNKGVYFGEDLKSGRYSSGADAGLASMFEKVAAHTETLTTDSVFTGFYPYPGRDHFVNYVAKPLFEFGVLVGVVVMQYSNESVCRLLGGFSHLAGLSETYLVAPDHRLHSTLTRVSERPASIDNLAVESALAGLSARQAYPSYDDAQVLAVSSPVDVYGEIWALVTEIPSKPIFNEMYATLGIGLAIVISVVLIIGAVAWHYSGVITEPIKQLTLLGDELLEQQGARQDAVEHQDEIRRIERYFYAMREAMLSEEASNQAKSRFLAAASHDLRQPLHAMGLFISALEPYVEDATGAKHMRRLKSSHDSLTKLFNALMDMARLEACAVTVNKETFCVDTLLNTLEGEYRAQAKAQGVKLRVAHCGAYIHTDSLLLERMLRNLLTNALRYAEGGKVLLGCRRRGDRLSIQVCDNGVGMTREQQQEVFKAFVQLDKRSDGLGLGLSIVEKTAKLLGLPLGLRSESGKGSIFTLEAPVVAKPEAAFMEYQAEASGVPARQLVVVLDDDQEILQAMEALLTGWGCDVVMARSLVELSDKLDELSSAPDLLLADVELANGENGVDAIELMSQRLQTPFTPALITGDTSVARMQEAAKMGLLMLYKPVAPAQLRSLLMHAQNQRQSETV
ncbi:Signal transduction histidine kinase [Hahella chejuensis KCTC 2396]|uniref:histidine kinase n=1 Tax=Hahella chejuensis (strain KCTC 2396) TaxID=349521 RepID=Q2SAW4_HAHCH|nr:ATP-binding protein [Hahella chejuensis]ABC32210.1 Signal transduction histidine kinase [Hahella chejuensis KCTC 2396]